MVKRISSHRQNDFYVWLCEYLKNHSQVDPIADLANDVKRDSIQREMK